RDEANLAKLDEIRNRVDAGDIELTEAYSYYNKLMDEFAFGLTALAKDFDDAEIAYLRLKAMPLFLAADELSRAYAFAAAAMSSGGMTEEQFRVFADEVGAYRENLSATEPSMLPEVRSRYEKLRNSDSWENVTKVENAILTGSSDLPMPPDEWQQSVTKVGKTIGSMYFAQSGYATDLSLQRTGDTLTWSIVGGSAAVLFGVGVFVIALRSANRLVRRLTRLRSETLDMAEQRLPELVSAVRGGEYDEAELDELRGDAGTDEIGQVADAFNKAQQTAIAEAVEEARIRGGTRTVFLNIAHRSQVIVHRQLKLLDEAERSQEDPDQLDMLFQLDHMSTRARRNAENLIILGGKQPGRQWRDPVAVDELVRGAVAETEDYARVSVGRLPEAAVQGAAVGDVVHLLAELVDNATAYSPPESRVELRGNAVGRGIVLEVEDQGLGIEQERRAELNRMLANPPEFSVMTLSEEPRLGLFVVARLAGRHGINVTLRESAYGGTRAIVLLRTELIQSESAGPAEEPARKHTQSPPPAQPAGAGAPTVTETTGQLNGQLHEQPDRGPNGHSAESKPPLPSRRSPSRTVNGSSNQTANGSSSQTTRPAGSEGRHQSPEPARQPTQQRQQPPQQSHQPSRRDPDAGGTGASRGEPSVFHDGRVGDSAGPQQGLSPDRPPLPQRRRQQHIAPQLR